MAGFPVCDSARGALAYGHDDTLVPPNAQAIPIATKWESAKRTNHAVWLQITANSGHNVTVHTLNNTYLDRFLRDVRTRLIH